MTITTPVRATALVSVMIASLLMPWQASVAGDGLSGDSPSQAIQISSTEIGTRSISLGVGKSLVVDFPRDIKDVLVANPTTANAVIRSARRAYIIGSGIGQTNIFFFDAQGRQLAGLDLVITRNLNGIRAALKQVLPNADIRVEAVGDGIILSGSVASQADAQQAYDIVSRLVYAAPAAGGPVSAGDAVANDKIVNDIVVLGDTAYDFGWHEFTLEPKNGGETARKRQRYLELWKKNSSGEWKISIFMNNDDVREELAGCVSHWFLSEEQAGKSK